MARSRITLYVPGGPSRQWGTDSHVYVTGPGALEFKDQNGREVSIYGSYVIEREPEVKK